MNFIHWWTRLIFLSKKYSLFILFFLVANLLVINKLNEHAEMLKSKHSPWGIVSLELSWSQAKQDSILNTWKNTTRSFIKQGTECPANPQILTAIQAATAKTDGICCSSFFM